MPPVSAPVDRSETRFGLRDVGWVGIIGAVELVILSVVWLVVYTSYDRVPSNRKVETELWSDWVQNRSADPTTNETLPDILGNPSRERTARQLLARLGKTLNQVTGDPRGAIRVRSFRLHQVGLPVRDEADFLDELVPQKQEPFRIKFPDSGGRDWELEVIAHHDRGAISLTTEPDQVRAALMWLFVFGMGSIGLLFVGVGGTLWMAARYRWKLRVEFQRLVTMRRQMTHEVRNAMTSFTFDTGSVMQLVETVDRVRTQLAPACEAAALEYGVSLEDAPRLLRTIDRTLAKSQAGITVDLTRAAAAARGFCERFNPTVEYFNAAVLEVSASLDQAELTEHLEVVYVPEVWEKVLRMLELRLRDHRVLPKNDIKPDVAPIFGYRRKMLYALFNLGKNAITAMSHLSGDKSLTFTCEEVGDEVVVTVHNPGPPIPPDLRSRLFRAPASTQGTGRGYGLLVVKDGVQANGGHVRLVHSDDRGTLFEMRLPSMIRGKESENRPAAPKTGAENPS